MRIKPIVGAGVSIGVLCAGAVLAADWPQWRGPDRTGLSKETGLLKEWPAAGPKLLWQAKDIGYGYSTPAVVGNRLYLMSNKGLADEYVQCLNATNGKPVWTVTVGKVGLPDQQPNYPAARSTPTVDGNVLYALGSAGDLVCLETSTGKLRWRKSLVTDFGGKPGIWAYSESPLIDGNTLVCTPGGAEATMVALNKKNGNVIWKSAVPEAGDASYASVTVAVIAGVRQYVQFVQKGVIGVEASTGKFLWRYTQTAHVQYGGNIATPVIYGDYVYSGSGLVGGGLALVKSSGGTQTTESVYFSKKLPTAIGGAVRIGDYLYGTTSQALICVEFKTGALKWEERCVGPASVCFADGRLYVHGENGDLALVEATPDAYREKGRVTPPSPPDRGQSKAWAYPVVANGKLYIRDLGTLWCYDVKAPS